MFGKECLAESQGDIWCIYTGKEKRPFHCTYLRFSGNGSMKVLFLRVTKNRITSGNHSHKSWHVGAPCMNMAPQRWARMSLHGILGTTVCIYSFIEVAARKQGLCISEMIRSRKANMWGKTHQSQTLTCKCLLCGTVWCGNVADQSPAIPLEMRISILPDRGSRVTVALLALVLFKPVNAKQPIRVPYIARRTGVEKGAVAETV